MKRSYTLLCATLFCLGTHAQTIALNGAVAIQNSAYETGTRQYISDASIRAPLSKPTVSDRSGKFMLEFSGVASGTPVRLNVNKPGYEVVNARDLEAVVIGRTALLEVVMVEPGKLAEAQLHFYEVVTTTIEASYERRMRSLRDEQTALDVR